MADATTEPAGNDRYLAALRRFSSDLRMARQVWQSMVDRQVPAGREHYELLLQAHLDGRDLDGARRVIDAMVTAGIPPAPSVRWQLALATGRSGKSADATAQFDQLRDEGVELPDHLLPAVFSVEVTAGRLPVARAHLRRMAARGIGARPDEYRALLDDVLDRRAIKDGLALFDAMVAGGRTPSPRDIQTTVSMMSRSGHPDRAEQLVTRLRDAGVGVAGDALTDIALGWARSGDLDRTRIALAAVEEAGGIATSHHHNALLTAVVASGDLQNAWNAAVAMSDRAIPSGANLEGLVDLALAKSNLPLAVAGLDWMEILGIPAPPAKVADVVGALLSAGKLGVATELYFSWVARGVTADRRRARDLVEAWVKAGRLDRAGALLARFRKDGTLTNGRHYGPVLTGLVRSKRIDEAVTLLREMLSDGITPTVADASRLVAELVHGGQLDPATSLIGTLADASIAVDEPTYRELMWAYARKGQYDPAKAIHDRMVAAGITPDDRHEKALQWASGETQRRLDDAPDGDAASGPPSSAPPPEPPSSAPPPEPPSSAPPPEPPSSEPPSPAPPPEPPPSPPAPSPQPRPSPDRSDGDVPPSGDPPPVPAQPIAPSPRRPPS